MSAGLRVGVFCSAGRDLDAVIVQVETRFPDAQVLVLAPPWLARGRARGLGRSEIVEIGLPHSSRDLRGLVRLALQLRAARFSHFVTLYPSRRLRAIAAVSGAAQCSAVDEEGRWIELSTSLTSVLLGVLYNEATGRLALLRVWAVVRFTRVRPVAPKPRL